MKTQFLFFALVLFSLPAFAADIAVNVPALAGKTKAEVGAILGEYRDCGPSEYGERCYYPSVDTWIYFRNGEATRATVNSINRVEKVPFDESALEYIGLKPEKPTMKDKAAMIWCPIQGLRCVMLLGGKAIVIFDE